MKPLIRCTILFISLLTVVMPQRAAKACGFYILPGQYRFWILQPDLTNQPDLTPFFFASSWLYKGDITAAKETYPQQNIEEWFTEIKGKAARKDIDVLLNETRPQDFFDQQDKLVKTNSFLAFLAKPANKALYRYFIISKKLEQIVANPDPWEEQAGATKRNIHPLIEEMLVFHGEAKSPFLKLRSAYQLERLYDYNLQQDQGDEVYRNWIAPLKSKSWIKTAALYERTFAKAPYERNYLLSKVFDKGNYNRTPCLVRFSMKETEGAMKLAKTNHERNVLLAMKTFNFSGRSLSYIKQIYNSEPSYKELPFLLLREINKVEDWLVTNKVTDFDAPAVYGPYMWDNYDYPKDAAGNYARDKAYSKNLYEFLVRMINDHKNKQEALLNLYAAHLCLLNGNMNQSAIHLQQAAQDKNQPRNVRTQIAINTFLLDLENGFTDSAERKFMKIIKTPNDQLGVYDPAIMKSQLVLYTGRKMISKGDRARGLMLLSRTDRALGEIPSNDFKGVWQEIDEQANENDYNQMLQIFSKKDKSSFEQFVLKGKFSSPLNDYEGADENGKGIVWDKNKILDCKASWYIRHYRLEEALTTLKMIPGNFWDQYPYIDHIGGDPFFLNVYHPSNPSETQRRSLNKKMVIEEMVRLQNLARYDKRKAAECYFQLANAWYNMTYYGRDWLIVKQWRSTNDLDRYNDNLKPTSFNNDYFGCQHAKTYYLQAIQLTTDKKLAALCFFMANQCDKNNTKYQWRLKAKGNYTWDYKPEKDKSYLRAQEKGIDMDYYKSIVEECEQYQSFIRQYNKAL